MKKSKACNIVLLISVVVSSVLAIVLSIVFKLSLIELIVCITGILYLSLLADKNLFNFIAGIINVLLYCYVAYRSMVYGEMIFYLAFDLPFSIIAFVLWTKHKESKFKVEIRSLTKQGYLIIIGVFVAISIVLYFLLNALNDASPIIDSISAGASVVATILMAQRYKEQWWMWIVVYIISTILWIDVLNVLMIIMSAEGIIISILGYIIWRKENKKNLVSPTDSV